MSKTKVKNDGPGMAFLEAAKLSCKARIKEAEARVELYLKSPQGVADHPQILDELLKAASEGSEAHDQLSFLEGCEEKW